MGQEPGGRTAADVRRGRVPAGARVTRAATRSSWPPELPGLAGPAGRDGACARTALDRAEGQALDATEVVRRPGTGIAGVERARRGRAPVEHHPRRLDAGP